MCSFKAECILNSSTDSLLRLLKEQALKREGVPSRVNGNSRDALEESQPRRSLLLSNKPGRGAGSGWAQPLLLRKIQKDPEWEEPFMEGSLSGWTPASASQTPILLAPETRKILEGGLLGALWLRALRKQQVPPTGTGPR